MDLHQQIHYLLSTHEFEDTTISVKQCIEKLNLKPNYPIILVGGTNGKGSTCAYLTNILKHAGYKVGTFTSPHIFEYNERISINNTPIDNTILSEILDKVIQNTSKNLGLFKTFTLAAHLYFIQQSIDIAVIEVGIGGLNDITNLFEPTISAITTIGFDHCNTLGNTLDEIGLQKAGIFRSNKPAFVGMKNPPESVFKYTQKINSQLQVLGTDFKFTKHDLNFDVSCKDGNKYFGIPMPALRGVEQLDNASLAIAILNNLKNQFPIPISAIKTGILTTTLLGRLSILPGQPQIVLDVAHNSQAISHMLKNMIKLPFAKSNYAVFGIAADKDIDEIIKLCKEYFSKWFIAPIHSARSINNNQLMQIMQNHGIDKNKIVPCDKICDALNSAKKISTNDDRIVCFGSFLVVEEAYKCN